MTQIDPSMRNEPNSYQHINNCMNNIPRRENKWYYM